MNAIGRYEVRRELGRGMMGRVYEAFDPELGRLVALKTLSLALPVPEDEQRSFEQRFLNEAKAVAGLSHPNIMVVYDVGRDPATGVPFMALEYLYGRTLAETPLPLPWREAFRIAARVAEALHAAHGQGIVHRDVKPANIMLLPSGEPKVMDFGIAKLPASQLTAAGQVFGTPSNMSPEQALGEELDARSDLFSLGTVLYELLTGVRPFGGADLRATLGHVVHHDPPPPSSLVPGLPPGADDVIARALAKERPARYAEGHAMAEDLEDLLAGRPPRHAAAAGGPPRTGTSPLAALVEEPGPAVPAAAATLRTPASRAAPKPPAATESRLPAALAAVVLVLVAAILLAPLLQRRPTPLPVVPQRPPSTTIGGRGPTKPSPEAAEPARLAIDFDHPLKSGTLRVWIDDEPVLDRAFSGRLLREVFSIKVRRGSLDEVVDVAPGRHRVRVQVSWEGNSRTDTIAGSFREGATRTLAVRIGRLRKDLSLEWK